MVKRLLIRYYALLQSSRLTNGVLHSLPLPRSLDPNTPGVTVPSRLYTLLLFIRDSVAALVMLPFCFVPLIIHTPVYIMAGIGAKVESEEEKLAQNKLIFGLISLLLIYPALFFFLWALFWYTSLGALLSAFTVYLFAVYHIKIIDGKLVYPQHCLYDTYS